MTKLVVDCEKNDPVDIKCGGPVFLGFDFYVNDDDVQEMGKFIQQCLKKYNRPMISITLVTGVRADKVWTKEDIENCIKEGY